MEIINNKMTFRQPGSRYLTKPTSKPRYIIIVIRQKIALKLIKSKSQRIIKMEG